MCLEVLTRLLITTERYSLFSGIKISRRAPTMFADDLMVFSRAHMEDAEAIYFCLLTYSNLSGQKINFTKSGVLFSPNTNSSLFSEICSTLQMRKADLGGKYLGIPLHIPRSLKAAFREIQDRILARLDGWKAKCLS